MAPARLTALALVLLVAAGAGTALLTPASGDAEAAVAAQGAAPIPWDLLDCTFAIASVDVPSDALLPYLPPGFAPVGARGLVNTPATSRTTSVVGFEVNTCASGAGLDGEQVADMTYSSFWVGVRPPIKYFIPGVFSYFVNWDVLVPDGPRRAAFQDAGLPARDGRISIDAPAPGEPGGVLNVEYTHDGLGTFRYGGPVVADAAPPGAGTFAQWTQASDGDLAFWQVDWATTTNFKGAGTIELDPASWYAELFGATTLPAQLWVGEWSYTNGHIVLPE